MAGTSRRRACSRAAGASEGRHRRTRWACSRWSSARFAGRRAAGELLDGRRQLARGERALLGLDETRPLPDRSPALLEQAPASNVASAAREHGGAGMYQTRDARARDPVNSSTHPVRARSRGHEHGPPRLGHVVALDRVVGPGRATAARWRKPVRGRAAAAPSRPGSVAPRGRRSPAGPRVAGPGWPTTYGVSCEVALYGLQRPAARAGGRGARAARAGIDAASTATWPGSSGSRNSTTPLARDRRLHVRMPALDPARGPARARARLIDADSAAERAARGQAGDPAQCAGSSRRRIEEVIGHG